MPTVGSIVGDKYRIDRAIGAGGMGTVFAATHLQLGTPVALKFLAEKIRDSKSNLERFTREAKASAQLRSQHICRVSDFGVEDGLPYIAMELLEGIDLAHLLDAGPLPPDRAVEYVLQACVGLAEAHGLGIVHRDLKPGNLFLTKHSDGSPLVKVLDFGIAKVPVDERDRAITQTATVVGSPGYMAPEQLRSSKSVDSRADVWSLGIILYELISRRHPFPANAMTEVAVKIAMDDPVPLTEAAPELRDVVMRCLRKDPGRRYTNASELASALAPFARKGASAAAIANRFLHDALDNRPTILRPKPTVEKPKFPAIREHLPRPRERSLGLLALLALLVIAGGAVLVVVLVSRDEDPPPAVARKTPPTPSPPPPQPRPVDVPPVDAAGELAPPPVKPTVAPRRIERSSATPTMVNEKLVRATAMFQAKGLLGEDAPNIAKLRSSARAALPGDPGRADRLAEELLVAIDAFSIDKPFVGKKIARIANRIGLLQPAEPLKHELDELMQDVEKHFNAGEYVQANTKLSVVAGMLARAPRP